ncbi:MAG: replication initiator protein A [Clostridiales bacterium]|nr:replication initiator protein A [Clostridiales bacterium]
MPKIVTLQSYNTIQFYQIPQAFYHNPKYIGMNPSSRETYAMLRNLLPLSINNGWINEAGEIYVKLSREKLMLRLGIKKDKMTKVFKELRDLGLIVEKRIGCNKCNEIYICDAEDLNQVYSDEELLDLLDENLDEVDQGEIPANTRNAEKQNSETLKNRSQESDKTEFRTSEKQSHNKNNFIKTNENKNKQQQPKEKEDEVVVAPLNDHLSELDSDVIDEFKHAFGRKPSPKVQESLRGYLNRFEKDVVLHALDIAGNKNKGWDYAQGILKVWWQEQVFTFEGVFEYEEKYRE